MKHVWLQHSPHWFGSTLGLRFAVIVLLVGMFAMGRTPICLGDEGRIAIRILDADGDETPARVWVDVRGRRLYQPETPETVTPYAKDQSFSCDGSFTMIVPAGTITVHVEKGKEFRAVDTEIDVPAGKLVDKLIRIKRWVDMPDEGWYSTDLHVHLGSDDPRVLKQLALADDVHLVPSFTYWIRGTEDVLAAEWPDDSYLRPIQIDSRHLITRNNIEIERIQGRAVAGGSIGATFLFNLQKPVTAARHGEHFPTDAEFCRLAREHSPKLVLDSDKPSWAETVVGAALGQLDTIQLCHNHYYRLTTGPGGYGMIGPLAVGESNSAEGDGLFHRTNALYYRFLNCGFRLGVSGGSAIGVKAMPTGHHRVYAHIKGALNADSIWSAIREGRTFVTTGPMLTLTANEQQIGSTIPCNSARPEPILVETKVRSIQRLESIQIIHNGRVIASRPLSDEKLKRDQILSAHLAATVSPKRSGWIASRVFFRAPDGLLRQAHTSPIYLAVDDQPTAFAEDARYMIRWLDRLKEVAELPDRFPDEQAKRSVLTAFSEARARYEAIIRVAETKRP